MNELELATAMLKAIKKNAASVAQLIQTYDKAQFARYLQLETEKYYTERVLEKYEFYAEGKRVTEEEDTYLLSDEDFFRLCELRAPLLYAQGIADKYGNYLTDYVTMVADARKRLAQLVIPVQYRHVFADNIALQEKLISTIEKLQKK